MTKMIQWCTRWCCRSQALALYMRPKWHPYGPWSKVAHYVENRGVIWDQVCIMYSSFNRRDSIPLLIFYMAFNIESNQAGVSSLTHYLTWLWIWRLFRLSLNIMLHLMVTVEHSLLVSVRIDAAESIPVHTLTRWHSPYVMPLRPLWC